MGPPRTGTLRIISVPAGARVSLDGVGTGLVCPAEFEAGAGDHTVGLTGQCLSETLLAIEVLPDSAVEETVVLTLQPHEVDLQWGRLGSGPGEILSAGSVASNGVDVFVADSLNHRIDVFTVDGLYLTAWPYSHVADLVFQPPDSLFCILPWKILILNTSGDSLGEVPLMGRSTDPVMRPFGLAIGKTGAIYYTDRNASRVRRIDRSGNVRFSFFLDTPEDIQSLSDGNLAIITFGLAVRLITPEGQTYRRWGRRGTAPGEFMDATAFCVTAHGQFVVVDPGNSRLQWFSGGGAYLKEDAIPESGEQNQASGIAIIDNCQLYVSDRIGKVYRFASLSSP